MAIYDDGKHNSGKEDVSLTLFSVSVEKALYCTGTVKVYAQTADEAIDKVEARITKGELQTTDVEWNDPQYEDASFKTTGDVD
jgi:hypothetical protein